MSYGFAAVHSGTGVILRVVSCLRQHAALQASNSDEMVAWSTERISDLTHYIDGKREVQGKAEIAVTLDKPVIIADGVDIATITDVPADVTVTWPDGITDPVIDGVVAFAVDLPGTYNLILQGIQHLTQEVVIEALPAT